MHAFRIHVSVNIAYTHFIILTDVIGATACSKWYTQVMRKIGPTGNINHTTRYLHQIMNVVCVL